MVKSVWEKYLESKFDWDNEEEIIYGDKYILFFMWIWIYVVCVCVYIENMCCVCVCLCVYLKSYY